MRFIDWFAGIGGFRLGLERAGHTCVAHSEIDPYASAVYNLHWPGSLNLGDITKIRPELIPDADLWCGGIPCQPFSVAGSRRGEQDERHLWPAFEELLRVVRPRYVLIENVPGLLTDAAARRILCDLAACGYDAEWSVIGANDVGAPHRRKRVWIWAYLADPRGNQFRETKDAEVSSDQLATRGEDKRAEQRGVVADAASGRRSDDELQAGRDESGQCGEDELADATGGSGQDGATPRERQGRSASGGDADLADARRERMEGQQQARPAPAPDLRGCRVWPYGWSIDPADVVYTQGRVRRYRPRQGEGEDVSIEAGGESHGRHTESGDAGNRIDPADVGYAASEGLEGREREVDQGDRTRPADASQESNRGPTQPVVGRVAHGVPNRVHRLKCLGNAVVPQVVEWIGRRFP